MEVASVEVASIKLSKNASSALWKAAVTVKQPTFVDFVLKLMDMS
jgi:hypothetical protein